MAPKPKVIKSREEFLNNAGQVVSDLKKKDFERFGLKIARGTLDIIHEDIKDRVGWSATTWIHEAIDEKIKRIGQKKKKTS